jgi:hypothetical protein
MKSILAAIILFAAPAHATETVVYPNLPKGCAAIVDQDDKEVVVLVRCRGQIDWVVWAGAEGRSVG